MSKTITALLCVMMCGAASADGKLKVVTTTTDLRSIVEAVGGDKVEAASLGTGHEDPHFIEARPSYMVLTRNADLWVCVGMELEIGYEGLIIDGSHNPKIRKGAPGYLDASNGVLKLEIPTGKVDRSMGDVHPLGNPHYWLDPLNVRIVAKNVAAKLSELDAADSAYFTERTQAFQKRIDEAMFGAALTGAAEGARLWAMLLKGELDNFAKEHGVTPQAAGWWGAMKSIAGTKIITYHRSWTYLATRFGLDVVDQLEPKPGIEPTPAHLAEVIDEIKGKNVRFLLMEPFYSRSAPDFVSEKTGVKVVQVANSVGGSEEARDYIGLIDGIVKSCVAAAH